MRCGDGSGGPGYTIADELPLVALLGCFAEGETIVRGAHELRLKESDRIATVVEGVEEPAQAAFRRTDTTTAIGQLSNEAGKEVRVFGLGPTLLELVSMRMCGHACSPASPASSA